MAVKMIFEGTERSNHESEMYLHANEFNEVYIRIGSPNTPLNYICLDKQSAIKFSKVLRTEISKLTNQDG